MLSSKSRAFVRRFGGSQVTSGEQRRVCKHEMRVGANKIFIEALCRSPNAENGSCIEKVENYRDSR